MKTTKTRIVAKRPRRPEELPTERTAIRNHCLECMGYDAAAVRTCSSPGCWLFPYRLGNQGDLAVFGPESCPRAGNGGQTGEEAGSDGQKGVAAVVRVAGPQRALEGMRRSDK